MFESKWIFKDREFQGSELHKRILQVRDMEISGFTTVDFNLLNDPYLINEMYEAVECIMKHIDLGSKICVHGDYDADGVTSAYILYDYLKSTGVDVQWFIPDRFDDGYGISMEKAGNLLNEGVSLLITTDCGVTAFDEVDTMMNDGIDVIITDHHQTKGSLPKATAVLCNTRNDNLYPFPFLSGAGMAFKLVQALSMRSDDKEAYKKYIGICAIGTIADIVPLTGENKVIASLGIDYLRKNKLTGIDAIIENAGLEKSKIDSYAISFMIGPRINAAGRMGNAGLAFVLLNESSMFHAVSKATELSKLNNLRKIEQDRTFNELRDHILDDTELLGKSVIIVFGHGLHKGVLGIVASKLVDYFCKPVFVLTEENGVCEGSGRSTGDFSLIRALEGCKDLLLGYGGHDMAAGMKIESINIREFRKRLDGTSLVRKKVVIDTVCKPEDMDMNFLESLDKLGPFGSGNERPVVAIEKAFISNKRNLGKNGTHISFDINKGNSSIRCIAFNSFSYKDLIVENQLYDFAVVPEINEFKGFRRPQARLLDISLHDSNGNCNKLIALKVFIRNSLGSGGRFSAGQLIRELFAIGMPETAYKIINKDITFTVSRESIESLYRMIDAGESPGSDLLRLCAEPEAMIAAEILDELGIVSVDRKDLFSYYSINIKDRGKKRLEDSNIYRSLME